MVFFFIFYNNPHIRNSKPNFDSALTLLSKVAMDKEDTYFKYPIYIFKFDKKLNEKTCNFIKK